MSQQDTTSTLPRIIGSPKQVEWAQRIRMAVLASCDIVIAETPKPVASEHHYAEGRDRLATETDARFWIENYKWLTNGFRPEFRDVDADVFRSNLSMVGLHAISRPGTYTRECDYSIYMMPGIGRRVGRRA